MAGKTPFLAEGGEKERIEIRLVANELLRREGVSPHVAEKIKDKKRLLLIIELFQSFYLGLDKEGCCPTLPYSGGVLEQPYFEHEVWRMFLIEYLIFRSEKIDEEKRKLGRRK
jgi:hypothetical protein